MGGDLPCRPVRARRVLGVAPRGRGSAPHVIYRGQGIYGCPARAGIRLIPILQHQIHKWSPRTGGDPPVRTEKARSSRTVAPHGRGSASSPPQRHKKPGVCPAWAGVCLDLGAYRVDREQLPRMGGGQPRDECLMVISKKVAPHGRGSAHAISVGMLRRSRDPERTGVSLPWPSFGPRTDRRPRTYGGQPGAKTGVAPAASDAPPGPGGKPSTYYELRQGGTKAPPGRGSAELLDSLRLRRTGRPAPAGVCPEDPTIPRCKPPRPGGGLP